MAVGGLADTGSGDGDLDRFRGLRAPGDGDDGGLLERRERLRRNTVRGYPALTESFVAARGAEPSCRPRRRFSGVNRQSSSRPAGTSKASTSKELNCSPLLSAKTPISRPPLPSAVR
jgi:hypothetical protein